MLKPQKLWFILCSCMVLFMAYYIGLPASAQSERTFTPQELAKFNGRNEVPAYVAVNGVVYDLTNVPEWAGGKHFCPGAIAGKDLTFIWFLTPRSHRNSSFLKRFPVVGRMVSAKSQPSTAPSPEVPRVRTMRGMIIEGLTVAIIITFLWLVWRLRKSRL